MRFVEEELVIASAELFNFGPHFRHPVCVAEPIEAAGIVSVKNLELSPVFPMGSHDIKFLIVGNAIKPGFVLLGIPQTFISDAQIVRRTARHGIASLHPRVQSCVNRRSPSSTRKPGHIHGVVGVMVLGIVERDHKRFEEKAERPIQEADHRFVRFKDHVADARQLDRGGAVWIVNGHRECQHRISLLQQRGDHQPWRNTDRIHVHVVANEPIRVMPGVEKKQPPVAVHRQKMVNLRFKIIRHFDRVLVDPREVSRLVVKTGVARVWNPLGDPVRDAIGRPSVSAPDVVDQRLPLGGHVGRISKRDGICGPDPESLEHRGVCPIAHRKGDFVALGPPGRRRAGQRERL